MKQPFEVRATLRSRARLAQQRKINELAVRGS
jgi:hypothetical protein